MFKQWRINRLKRRVHGLKAERVEMAHCDERRGRVSIFELPKLTRQISTLEYDIDRLEAVDSDAPIDSAASCLVGFVVGIVTVIGALVAMHAW